MAKVVKSKRVNKKIMHGTEKNAAPTKKVTTKIKAATVKVVMPTAKRKVAVAPAPAEDKKTISQKLMETIEKRKLAREKAGEGKKPNPFGRPPGRRRGRRPKNIDYNPENREDEENYVVETENESLEYDTGIRVREGREDAGFVFERSEDFDEELNFDW